MGGGATDALAQLLDRQHAAPVWGVWLDGALYFGTNPSSAKGRNLAANPAVVAHTESGDDCVILEGTIEPIRNPDRARFDRIADAYEAKYGGFRPEYPTDAPGPAGFFALRPRIGFAWTEQEYPKSAVRFRFR
jgi:hypothetical protein